MEQNEYLKLAEVEDRMWYFRSLHSRLHQAVRPAMTGPAFPRLLDAGCGTGGLLRRLALWEPGWTAEGVELSPVACELARRRGSVVREGAVERLPYPPEHFNAIVCGDVLYHLENPLEALREFQRCLRPGGRLALNVPAYRWLWSYHDERVSSKHRFTRREMLGLVGGAGLRAVSSTYWNTLPFPLIVLRRKLLPAGKGESDVKLSPRPVEAILNAAMKLERAWTATGARLPFGSSVFVVAEKSGA